ncbi:hypothetical protein [Mariniflexile sp.]|uniref:hypothetical protein n=1 Tax=Mariniflexile sp. TaxID=1979402 RepID=UPI00356950E0
MVLNSIEKLLEKYENGETSLKEEQQLKNYFSQEAVPPHLEMYKPMFAYFLVNQQEQFTKALPLKPKKVYNLKWIAVAAVAVFMLGVYFKEPIKKSYQEYAYGTYDDPEEALEEVTKQLAIISNHFNKGVSTVGYLNEIENTTSIVFKNN